MPRVLLHPPSLFAPRNSQGTVANITCSLITGVAFAPSISTVCFATKVLRHVALYYYAVRCREESGWRGQAWLTLDGFAIQPLARADHMAFTKLRL